MRSFNTLLLAAVVAAEVHVIDVGKSGLTFSPETFSATAGDTLVFHLYPNHDVVQGAFDKPCTPSQGGFFSGPFSSTDGGKKKFVVNVTSTDPVYWYCSVQKHCQSGMVGGVNVPTENNTIDKYKGDAKGVQQSETPSNIAGGELLEDEQLSILTASSPSASSTSSAPSSSSGSASQTSASSTASQSPSPSSSGSGSASSPSPTGAAGHPEVGRASGMLVAALGFAAWML